MSGPSWARPLMIPKTSGRHGGKNSSGSWKTPAGFAGDTIARTPDGTVMLGVFNADPERAAESFRKQALLEPAVACFGHGAPLTAGTARALSEAARRSG
ncbi:hypothetical protein [Dactylosporangium sp. NPDC000521]|uniref:hypothetical protein n=1 Tax=Dactylosporangium sp. NPDC000521 TaxID=3363975 RepID=UPI0036B8DF5B